MERVTIKTQHTGARSACPVRRGEEEIEGFRHPVLAREHRLNVPHEDGVEDGVQRHDDHAATQTEAIPIHRAHPDVVPLGPHTCLLIVGEVGAAKTKRNVGDDALKKRIKMIKT